MQGSTGWVRPDYDELEELCQESHLHLSFLELQQLGRQQRHQRAVLLQLFGRAQAAQKLRNAAHHFFVDRFVAEASVLEQCQQDVPL